MGAAEKEEKETWNTVEDSDIICAFDNRDKCVHAKKEQKVTRDGVQWTRYSCKIMPKWRYERTPVPTSPQVVSLEVYCESQELEK
jgi:hypothetical protein